MNIKVVKAGIQEVEMVAGLFNDYRVFYDQSESLDGARKFLSERIKNNESVIFLATNEEGTEAYGFTQLYPSFSSVSMKRVWILNDLFVSENLRGKGIGHQLLHTAKEFAQQTGAKGIALETGYDNTGAQKLYESLGYEKDTSYYHYFLTLGGNE